MMGVCAICLFWKRKIKSPFSGCFLLSLRQKKIPFTRASPARAMPKFVNAPASCSATRVQDTLRVKPPGTPPRGPITRRQHTLATKRETNEKRSRLLQLNDDLLELVLSFLPGKSLAAMETTCTHFRYGGYLTGNTTSAMPEHSAKRKLDALELGDMPPGFRCADFF